MSKGFFKRLRHRFQESWALYALVAGAVWLLGALPLGLARGFGRLCGRLAYLLDGGHRTLCLDNLAIAFPEKSAVERATILKKCYMHLGMCIADFCHFNHIRPEEFRGKWIVPEDGADARVQAALAKDRGLIAIGAHIGFWELSGFAYPTLSGRPVISVGRRIPAPRIDAMVNAIRARLGNAVVQQEGALRHLLRSLKDKNGVGVIMDQFGGRESPWVPFFGRDAATLDTCARLHLKTGAPLVCNVMLRQDDGRYLWRCREIEVNLEGAENEEQRIRKILEGCNREFEFAIRAAPEQWLWMHKRWRRKPDPVARPEPRDAAGSSATPDNQAQPEQQPEIVAGEK